MKIFTPSQALQGAVLAMGGVCALNMALAADPTCIDYYTVGESKCQPAASTPLNPPRDPRQPQLVSPADAQKPQDEVDKYLANYGKPPREFVEFYLNPTADNAQKWVGTYQQMLQKGQNLSKAWNDAEQLYGAAAATSAAAPLAPPQPVSALPAAVPPVVMPSQLPVAPPVTSLGAFAGNASVVAQGGLAGGGSTYSLTYYFSQVCPYCARMTPDLAELSKDKRSKLELTCVDVTPETTQSHPEPTYITSRLPCKWRLPEAGEIETQQVRQTPTLLLQKDGGVPLRLSGYVPLAQLRQYF